ncbi:MAG: MATE family efflux transporter [Clostridia bacterium]|nr:MATE family efflux transporter [Clostridia bacterium]
MSKFEKDLSRGSVGKQLWAFALPFIIANLIQSLYSVVDMIVVGQFSGTASMSGVNIGSQVTLLITNFVIGLCAGATVLIAQYLGSGARKALKSTISTLLTTLVVLAVVMTVFMVFFRKPILHLIQTPAESFWEADRYLLITALGTIFIFGYNALSAIMRGMGDSKNPLIFVGIACFFNVVLDYLLVAKWNMAASGAAIATVFSQAISLILCILYLKRNDFVFDFNLKSFNFHPESFRMLFKVGLPTSVQNVVVGLSFLFLTTIVNTLGMTESAALGAVAKFNSFAILPAIAMSSSIAAMSAQNLGAGLQDRAVQTMKIGTLIGFSMSCVVFAIAMLFPREILRIFANDEALVAAGTEYMRSFSYDYLLASIMFGLTGLFIGSGHTTFTLFNSMLASLLVRIPASYIGGIVMGMGMFGVGLGGPAASLLSLILALLFFFSGRWKKQVITKGDPVLQRQE